MLPSASVVLGVAAHVLGGGGAVDCVPLLVAAALGVLTTFAAQRVAGTTYRGAPLAVAMLGVGQLGIHPALSASLNSPLLARMVRWYDRAGRLSSDMLAAVLVGLLLELNCGFLK